jgi:predicted enzyme related to lactoylglutathione lyase
VERKGGIVAKNQFSYLELPANDIASLKTFYGTVFGWTHLDWGSDYATVHGSGLEAGYNGAAGEGRSKTPLAMVETDDIAAMEAAVQTAGGTITVPTFAYPGGKRFHFMDPEGNELAVMQPGA